MFIPSRKEVSAVISQSGNARYLYFVQRVADFEEVWGVGDDSGWSLVMDKEKNVEAFPVWPAEAFAAAYCSETWSGRIPKAIGLSEWQEKWLPGLSADGRTVAVFPVRGTSDSDSDGVVVSPETLKRELADAISHYE